MEENQIVSKLTFIAPPEYAEYVGGYRIGKIEIGYTQFNLTYKPNWFHRQMMKWFLGWHWFDNHKI